MEEIKSLSIDLRKKEEKKKVIPPKVKSIRKEVDKWQFDEKFLELDKQWECLSAIQPGGLLNDDLHLCTIKTPTLSAVMSEQGVADCAFEMRNGVKDVCREMRRQIQNKVSSYKMQDIQKQKYDDNKFVNLNFVIGLLHEKEMKCFYCRESVYLFYNFVRENKQWTLERIDNSMGHNTDNVEIACLLCNLRRRTMFHERYVFTKQMNIVKLG